MNHSIEILPVQSADQRRIVFRFLRLNNEVFAALLKVVTGHNFYTPITLRFKACCEFVAYPGQVGEDEPGCRLPGASRRSLCGSPAKLL
jgi:hypothetical protein